MLLVPSRSLENAEYRKAFCSEGDGEANGSASPFLITSQGGLCEAVPEPSASGAWYEREGECPPPTLGSFYSSRWGWQSPQIERAADTDRAIGLCPRAPFGGLEGRRPVRVAIGLAGAGPRLPGQNWQVPRGKLLKAGSSFKGVFEMVS